MGTTTALLADRIDAALPQTQCTRCGYPDCRAYAVAIADGSAEINLCPPGGREGIARLARLTGRTERPLDPAHGSEGPRLLAVIDEPWCIGCTLCLQACPVDCIVGGPKRMHTVIDALCTGCELCLPACPVDCIALVGASGERTGWEAWSPASATEARERYGRHRARVEREANEEAERLDRHAGAALPGAAPSPAHPATHPAEHATRQPAAPRSAVIEAALARARAARP